VSFDLELTGRRALVTAGTKGVGAAVVDALNNAGATVVATARAIPGDAHIGVLYIAAVFSWRQARRRVDATARGHGHSLTIRPCFSDRNSRAGNGCPGLIVHYAGDLAGSGLGTCWRRGGTPRARDDEAD